MVHWSSQFKIVLLQKFRDLPSLSHMGKEDNSLGLVTSLDGLLYSMKAFRIFSVIRVKGLKISPNHV